MSFVVFRGQVRNVSNNLDTQTRAWKQGGPSVLQYGEANSFGSSLCGNKHLLQLPKNKGWFIFFSEPLKQMIRRRFELIDSPGSEALVTTACH